MLKKEEKKAIEYLMLMKDKLDFNKTGFVYGADSIDTVLNLIEKQQAELEKKDEIIDYMINWIRERSIYAVDSGEELKQYFEKKVEG